MLLTGSGDECFGLLPVLFQGVAHLFTERSCRGQLLALPLFSGVLSAFSPLLLCVSFQFLVYCSVFVVVVLWGRGSVCPGGYAGLPQWWLGEYRAMIGVHLLVCRMSPKQVWSRCLVAWEPFCFLSVTWCGEASHGLGVQGVEVLILLGALFLPSVAPASQQDF
jgi:hypothetical protein